MRIASATLLPAGILAAFLAAPISWAQEGEARISHHAMVIGSNVRNASGPGQYSYQADYSVPTSFETMRLILVNTALSPQKLVGIIVAPSQSITNMTNPEGGAWTVVTVAGSRTPILAAATSPSLPSYTLSDEINLHSLPRSDGKTGSLVFTRVVTAQDAYGVAYLVGLAPNGSINIQTFKSAFPSETAEWGFAKGDFVNSNRLAMRPDNTTRDMALFYVGGVVYGSHTKNLTLMGVGDSLTQSFATATDYDGFGRVAASVLTTAGHPTS